LSAASLGEKRVALAQRYFSVGHLAVVAMQIGNRFLQDTRDSKPLAAIALRRSLPVPFLQNLTTEWPFIHTAALR
jgi:hypothetical protein